MEACVGAHHLSRKLQNARPRRPTDAREIRAPLFEGTEILRRRGHDLPSITRAAGRSLRACPLLAPFGPVKPTSLMVMGKLLRFVTDIRSESCRNDASLKLCGRWQRRVRNWSGEAAENAYSPLNRLGGETFRSNMAIQVGPNAIHLIVLNTDDGHQRPS